MKEEKEQKVGPDLHTHQAGAVDTDKTIIKDQVKKIEKPKHGSGIIDALQNNQE